MPDMSYPPNVEALAWSIQQKLTEKQIENLISILKPTPVPKNGSRKKPARKRSK